MVKIKSQKNNQAGGLTASFKNKILNLNGILLVFLIIFGIFYVAGTNNLAIKGFVLSDLKEQRGKIADENKRLELKVMTLSSYNVINEKIGSLKMVAAGEIDYVNGGEEIVAKK